MGLFDNILDRFNKAEFSVAPNKKLKSISRDFKTAFELTLVFYKGNIIAEEDLTLAALNKRTTKDVIANTNVELKIKGSMKVGDVESLFDKNFGVKVQIKDKSGNQLVDNKLTLGQASRA